MKAIFLCLALLIVASLSASGAEYAIVPRSLAEVINPRFKTALASHAPRYDYLNRTDKIRAFTQVYRSLNNGSSPLLSPGDVNYSDLYLPPVVPVPVYPYRREEFFAHPFETYIDGYGYHYIGNASPASDLYPNRAPVYTGRSPSTLPSPPQSTYSPPFRNRPRSVTPARVDPIHVIEPLEHVLEPVR